MTETKPVTNEPKDISNDARNADAQGIVDENLDTQIQDVQFPRLTQNPQGNGENRNLDLILDISVPISVELGRTSMLVKDVINLTHGAVVELDKLAGSPVDVLVRGKLIARGEVVVVEENFGVKITNISDSEERIRNLA